MSKTKTYWKGYSEKHQTPEFSISSQKEFQDDVPVDEFLGSDGIDDLKTGRRDFLKFMGFSVAAATLASCESPVIILYVRKNFPENKFNPDFCILNNGGFRSSLNKGSITIGDIFQIMPFDNHLLILEIQGEEMNDLIKYIKDKSTTNISRKSGVPLSGIRLKISGDKVNRCMISNKMYDPLKTYKVLTTNYLASGGDDMVFFKNCRTLLNTKLLLRDVIIRYIEELGKNNIKINAQIDGRVQVLQ